MALLDHQNTPSQGMTTSSAQRLMSRRTTYMLPTSETLLRPGEPNEEEKRLLLRRRQDTQTRYYNRTVRDLLKLHIGDVVRMKPNNNFARRKATVTQRLDDRSYMVETPEGGTFRRNRFHLRKTGEPRPPPRSDIPAEPP